MRMAPVVAGTSLQSYCDMLIEEYEEDLKARTMHPMGKGRAWHLFCLC